MAPMVLRVFRKVAQQLRKLLRRFAEDTRSVRTEGASSCKDPKKGRGVQ